MTEIAVAQEINRNRGLNEGSLDTLISAIVCEGRPMTLRQAMSRAACDADKVSATLEEKIRNGTLVMFRVGLLQYYAPPMVALTMKGPAFTTVMGDMVRNTVWNCQRSVKKLRKVD